LSVEQQTGQIFEESGYGKGGAMSCSRRLILCVDDDEDTCGEMSALLELSGYTVRTASNMSDGLTLARGQSFDIYLLDYNFFDGTGIELCQKLRVFDPATPIIFCSGDDRAAERELASIVGAQAYLVKPIDPKVLRQTIDSLLNAGTGKVVPQRASLSR
jgi:DNA-binding response OmpR family regulator